MLKIMIGGMRNCRSICSHETIKGDAFIPHEKESKIWEVHI